MEHKNKRKAVSNSEEESSSKRPKHSKIEGEELSMAAWYDTMLVKEGRLKQFDEDTAVWTDVTLKLYSNADLEIEVEPRYGKISSMPLDIGKSIRIRLKPSEPAAPLPRADYVGVFCIKNTPQYIGIKRGIHLVFAAEDPNEGEKWMHAINYTRLKRTLELKKHSHPLTPCHHLNETSSSVGPSTISLNEDLTCAYCARRLDNDQARHCEFCDYNVCGTCASFIVSHPAQKLEYSVNHAQHPLIRFHSVDDPQWLLQTQYAKEYICDVCSSRREGPVYHCVECGNYDECPDCFKQVATDAPTEKLKNESNDEVQLDIGYLSHVITKSGNFFELKQAGRKTLQAASMITTKCWDVSQIDTSLVPSAYFEVTFNQLEGQYVSVGIGNQIFVQNQLLGYEQNSFGYCCNGQVTQNVGTNMQVFPSYGNGDTVGVGMLLDSFNSRRLYFTKNGTFLGCFSERVHVGMDCFPGVSFTPSTCEQLKFSTNFTGPFMFDLAAVPDHRSARQNWFEQMPAEIIVRCLSHAAEVSQQVAEFFQVSKTFSSLASNNEIWKKLFLQRWPLQSSKLKLKSWMTLYKRRQDMEKHVRHQMRKHRPSDKYRNGTHYIENCDFEFQCPLIIEDIFGKEDENGNTHCDKCNKTVYKVNDTETLEQYTAMGRCVSLFIKPKLVPIPRIRMGGVPSSRHFRDPARSAVPKPFANLPERSKYKQIYDNQISGTLPSVLGRLPNLSFLTIQNNKFVGCVSLEHRLSGSFIGNKFCCYDTRYDEVTPVTYPCDALTTLSIGSGSVKSPTNTYYTSLSVASGGLLDLKNQKDLITVECLTINGTIRVNMSSIDTSIQLTNVDLIKFTCSSTNISSIVMDIITSSGCQSSYQIREKIVERNRTVNVDISIECQNTPKAISNPPIASNTPVGAPFNPPIDSASPMILNQPVNPPIGSALPVALNQPVNPPIYASSPTESHPPSITGPQSSPSNTPVNPSSPESSVTSTAVSLLPSILVAFSTLVLLHQGFNW